MKVYVYFIGKPRDEAANAIAAEFVEGTPDTRRAKCARFTRTASTRGRSILPL